MITKIRAVIAYPFRLISYILLALAIWAGVISSLIRVGIDATCDALEDITDTLEALKDIK